MPYGLPFPPSPEEMPISPQAPAVQAGTQRQAAPSRFLPPPPGIISQRRPNAFSPTDLLAPALGTAFAALGGDNLSNFGAGMVKGSSDMLVGRALDQRQKETDQEKNLIQNVDELIQKVRQLDDPENPKHAEVQAALVAYDQALADGTITGKEAAKIQQQIMGIGSIEGMLRERETKQKTDEAIRLAKINRQLKTEDYVDTPFGRMAPEDFASYKAREASMEASDRRAGANQAAQDRRQQAYLEAADKRQADRLRQQMEIVGGGRDVKFQAVMSDFGKAEESISEIQRALKRFHDTSIMNPIDKWVATKELKEKIPALSTGIGRALSERGVFTDKDRAVFNGIITPGLVWSELQPHEAQKRIHDLQALLNRTKQREINAYRQINPGSNLDVVRDSTPGLPAPPNPDDPLGILN